MFFVIVVCAYANFRLKKCFSYIVDVYLLVEKVENPDFTSSHMQGRIQGGGAPGARPPKIGKNMIFLA
jgi:hypothetical protein